MTDNYDNKMQTYSQYQTIGCPAYTWQIVVRTKAHQSCGHSLLCVEEFFLQ